MAFSTLDGMNITYFDFFEQENLTKNKLRKCGKSLFNGGFKTILTTQL